MSEKNIQVRGEESTRNWWVGVQTNLLGKVDLKKKHYSHSNLAGAGWDIEGERNNARFQFRERSKHKALGGRKFRGR